jgi:hypothetical protein
MSIVVEVAKPPLSLGKFLPSEHLSERSDALTVKMRRRYSSQKNL